ncbi:MAG: hypothetical protein AAGA68_15330 [Pseudomonadota bacterium]
MRRTVERERTGSKWRAHLKGLQTGTPAPCAADPHTDRPSNTPWWLAYSSSLSATQTERGYRATLIEGDVAAEEDLFPRRRAKVGG